MNYPNMKTIIIKNDLALIDFIKAKPFDTNH